MMNVRVARVASFVVLLQWVYTSGVLLLALMMVMNRLWWIARQSYPIATDSFFYLEEFRAFQAGAPGYYTSFSPFFLAWGLLGRVGSLPPELLYDVIIVASLLLLSYALAKGAIDRGWAFQEATLLGSVPWASDLLFYRHYAFPQQAFAIALVLCAVLPQHGNKRRMALLAGCGAISHLSAAAIVGVQVTLIRGTFQKILLTGLVGVVGAYFLSTERLIFDFTLSNGMAPSLVQACTFAQCSTREWFEVVWFGLLLGLAAVHGFRSTGVWLLVVGILLLPIWSHEGHMLYRLGMTALWVILALCVQARLARSVAVILLALFFCGRVVLVGKTYTEKGLPYRLLESRGVDLQRWMPNPGRIYAQHGEDFRLRYAWNGKGEHTGAVVVTSGKIRGCRPLESGDQGGCVSLGEGWYLVRRDD